MQTYRNRWALIAVFGWVGIAAAADEVSSTRRMGRLELSPCSLSGGLMGRSVDAQCTTLTVAENREAKDGRNIELAIAVIPATREAKGDPVFMLAGGPGQSARESYPGIAAAFAEVNKSHDIVLLDQRGTGASHRLACKSEPQDAGTPPDDADLKLVRSEISRCVAELSKNADLRFYSTTDAIVDLDAVREALGAATINLVGISYGTRVAQQYAKRYPAQTRTVTLDGVVPNTLVLGNDHAKNLERSLNLQLAQCAGDKSCADKLGNPRERLDALFTLLKTTTPLVRFRDAMTGQMREEKLTRRHVTTIARLFSYAPQMAAMLPLLLKEASEGRYEPLMALANLASTSLGDSISAGMEYSVMCTEDAAEWKTDAADAETVLGNEIIKVGQAACEVWPHGARPADFRAPLTGAGPVLLLSGDLDPVTPSKYGDEVAANLPNALHLVVKGQGHNVLPAGCVPRVLSKFIDTANAKTLDASCLKTVAKARPFVDFYGWNP